jgi:hypothetical protein
MAGQGSAVAADAVAVSSRRTVWTVQVPVVALARARETSGPTRAILQIRLRAVGDRTRAAAAPIVHRVLWRR